MILAQNPLLLSKLCLLARSVGCIEIRFYPKFGQVSLDNQHSAHLILTKRRYLFAAILIAIYALQCICRSNGASVDIGVVLAWVLLIMLMVSGCYVLEVRRKSIEIRDSINAIFQLDSILPDKSKKTGTSLAFKVNIAFGYAALLTVLLEPIVIVHGIHWVNPCKDTLVGYWLIPRCHSDGENSCMGFLLRLCVMSSNHWMWSFVGHGAVFGLTIMQLLTVVAMQQFIQR